jgi:GNAT superfamily N-acetyltransferase
MTLPSLSDITIRVAANRDRAGIEALVFGVLAEYGLEPDPESTDADLQDIEGNYLRAGGLFEVIEDRQGNLLGTVGLYPLDGDTCELRKMYFIPGIRGLGLGRYILERTIDHARRSGFKRVVLETSSKLEAANRLYTGFGFRLAPRDHLASRADQAYFLDLSQ